MARVLGFVDRTHHGFACQFSHRFQCCGHPHQFDVRIGRLPAGNPDRRLARHWAFGHHRHAAACHLCLATGVGFDHVGRYLLRRSVWRLDHSDFGQPPRRVVLGGYHHRWLPNGPPRACRPRLGRCWLELVFCGLRGYVVVGRFCGSVDRDGVCLWPCRILRPDGAGFGRRSGLGLGLFAQSHCHDYFGFAFGLGGHRCQLWHCPLHTRYPRIDRWYWLCGRGHGRVWLR